MSRLRLVALAVVAVLGLSASSCSDERGLGDAPVGERHEEPRQVLVNADRFPNLSIICDGSTAIYTNTRTAGDMAVVPDSEYCREGS